MIKGVRSRKGPSYTIPPLRLASRSLARLHGGREFRVIHTCQKSRVGSGVWRVKWHSIMLVIIHACNNGRMIKLHDDINCMQWWRQWRWGEVSLWLDKMIHYNLHVLLNINVHNGVRMDYKRKLARVGWKSASVHSSYKKLSYRRETALQPV